MPSAGDSFLIRDLPPLDAPGAAPDWSVRDINWGTLTGLVCRDLLDDSIAPSQGAAASPRLAPLAMTKTLSGGLGSGLGGGLGSGLPAGYFGAPSNPNPNPNPDPDPDPNPGPNPDQACRARSCTPRRGRGGAHWGGGTSSRTRSSARCA